MQLAFADQGQLTGVYFDVKVNGTSSLLLSLGNSPELHNAASMSGAVSSRTTSLRKPGQFSYHTSSLSNSHAPPVSLLARIDQEEYVLLPNSSALVSVSSGGLDPAASHDVRIIVPMTDVYSSSVIQLEGLWLDKGGNLLRVESSQLGQDAEEEDMLSPEDSYVGRTHNLGWRRLLPSAIRKSFGQATENPDMEPFEESMANNDGRRMLEIVTDAPGSLARQVNGSENHVRGDRGLLGGVLGWEYLLGEMFGVDHVALGLDGMCLIEQCIGGVGEPAGVADVFFRR